MRQMLRAAAAASVLVCAAHPATASDGVALTAEAGLGGVGRPGRWVPVRIAIANTGGDVTGDLVIEWGDTRLHRAVELASPSRTSVEVYVRTIDVRGSIGVSLMAEGTRLAAADAPVRMASEDAPLTVCVGSAADSGTPTCTVTIAPGASPRSMRGYDAADEVRWQAGPDSTVTEEQRQALGRWRAYHAIESQDVLSLAPRAIFTASATAARIPLAITIASVGGLATLLIAGWFWMRSRGRVWRSYGAIAGAVGVGVAVGLVAGRNGPGATVLVQHASTVQQTGNGAVVSMRGSIEYPAYSRYALTVLSPDGGLTSRRTARAEQWTDSQGRPVRQGTFGRGHREELEIESWAATAPFDVETRGDVVHVANLSTTVLTDCRFPEGFVPRDVGTLGPGGTVEAHAASSGEAPFFACTSTTSPLTMSEATFPVRIDGRTIVSVLLPTTPRPEDRR